MAKTVTTVRQNRRTTDRGAGRFTIAGDNSYPTGGYAIAPGDVGLGFQIDALDIVNCSVCPWRPFWNRATGKLQLVVMSTGAEVANAVNVTTFNCDVIAEGY